MVLLSPQGELGFTAPVASAETAPGRGPPGGAVHRRCPAAPGDVESHHEPGEACSLHNTLEGSNGKEYGRVTLFCSRNFLVMLAY